LLKKASFFTIPGRDFFFTEFQDFGSWLREKRFKKMNNPEGRKSAGHRDQEGFRKKFYEAIKKLHQEDFTIASSIADSMSFSEGIDDTPYLLQAMPNAFIFRAAGSISKPLI
jgi:hypothetical protein